MIKDSFYYKAVARGGPELPGSPISCLVPRLLQTSNIVFKKCAPLWFLASLLRNPGYGLDSTTALDTEMQRKDKVYVASCL